jgi:hypothetical protein
MRIIPIIIGLFAQMICNFGCALSVKSALALFTLKQKIMTYKGFKITFDNSFDHAGCYRIESKWQTCWHSSFFWAIEYCRAVYEHLKGNFSS